MLLPVVREGNVGGPRHGSRSPSPASRDPGPRFRRRRNHSAARSGPARAARERLDDSRPCGYESTRGSSLGATNVVRLATARASLARLTFVVSRGVLGRPAVWRSGKEAL